MLTKIPLVLFWFSAVAVTLWLGGCGLEGEAIGLRFNEVMPANSAAAADELGEFDDWIELYNAGEAEVELEGFFISDDQNDAYKKRLPAGLRVAAGGTLLLWADGDTEQGTAHLPFKLKAEGETLSLTSPEGELLDQLTFEGSVEDQVFGRYPDAEGEFILCASPTPGRSNGAACAD